MNWLFIIGVAAFFAVTFFLFRRVQKAVAHALSEQDGEREEGSAPRDNTHDSR
jgi:hypothetical protein